MPLKCQSTDAAHSDGVMRMSDDVSVIEAEQRHGPVRPERPEQPRKREDSCASAKSFEIPKQALWSAAAVKVPVA